VSVRKFPFLVAKGTVACAYLIQLMHGLSKNKTGLHPLVTHKQAACGSHVINESIEDGDSGFESRSPVVAV